MSVIRIRAADAASALNEVARQFGADALILSTSQKQGFVEVSVAAAGRGDRAAPGAPDATLLRAPAALPELPPRLVLLGPPGAGVTMLAARLAALALRRRSSGAAQLIAPRPDVLAPSSPLNAHARLLGLDVVSPLWPGPQETALAVPAAGQAQIIDLSGLGSRAEAAARGLLAVPGAACWLVLPTGLHLQAQDRIMPRLQPLADAIVLSRTDICPPTLEDRALPQRFGLPIAMLSGGSGLMDALRVPDERFAEPTTRGKKDVMHVAARLS